ncbi:hypothetical protein ACQCVP_20205 [Rossellomorea vietnamensis]|uniref:hypothetical protein n=1 Tax=Rossellomorea vietnamensis TaxID=218284 RepID=UPI003CF90943
MGVEREYSFFGFHGTSEESTISIAASQEFTYGTPRKDHWLGRGAYFFKDDELQAKYWARSKVKNHETFKGQRPYVIEVYIQVKESNFLNLDSRKGLESLESYLDMFEQEGLQVNIDDEQKDSNKVRCYLLSLLPDSIWVIQRTFDVKSRFDKHIQLKEMELNLHGTQVCVRDNEAIQPGSIEVREVDVGIQKPLRKTPRLF